MSMVHFGNQDFNLYVLDGYIIFTSSMFCGISDFLISISRRSSANSSVHPYSLSDVLSMLSVKFIKSSSKVFL